jgi:ATP-dependent DNA helicase RecG
LPANIPFDDRVNHKASLSYISINLIQQHLRAKGSKLQEELNNGIIRARRYRNRRIGEYLKELNLTEGKGTGIPTIERALYLNGSKPAVYETDGDKRRFFVVILQVNDVFLSEYSIKEGNQDKSKIDQDKLKIDQDKSKIDQDKILKNLKKDLLRNYKKRILKRMIYTLMYCDIAKTRLEILEHTGSTNHTTNFKEYIEPIVEMGFLKRTIPEIPTSRNQKYITMIEGNQLITSE